MTKEHEIQIGTYLLYENLFLLEKSDIKCMIDNRVMDFDPIESISYTSFLNMVCQTTDVNELIRIQKNELSHLLKTNIDFPPNKILFHRDTLLHYISSIIKNEINGKTKITGLGNEDNSLKYYQSLLLINNKINFLKYQHFEREFIKSFPYHFPNVLYWVYKQRIIRYSKIYNDILRDLSENKKGFLLSSIGLMKKKYGVDLRDHLHVIKGLFIWFIGAKHKKLESAQFNLKNISTFYIQAKHFSADFMFTLESLSKDLDGFYCEFQKIPKDEIDNEVYYYIQRFFDYPVFRINENEFCIIDLKFCIEGICSGLIWKLDAILKESNENNYSIQSVREQYGYLLEDYFCYLMKNIFTDIKITSDQIGQPDSILELNEEDEACIVLFEFSSKFYRISSLYNASSEKFIDDLNRILFSKQRNDRGKFVNLDRYVGHYSKNYKRLIPILLTENWIGDYDLLNRMDNILDRKIAEHNLKNLQSHKPLILSLDDIETFWAICAEGNENKEFVSLIDKWEKEQKGRYIFNFANYISYGKKVINEKYLDFFDFRNLGKY